MSNMDDLVVWLRQQLDDDERFARAAGWHRWSLGVAFGTVLAEGNGKTVCRDCLQYDAEHIARHDPARVLRDVEAKRRIVNSFAAGMPYQRGTEGYAIVRMVLRLLALPYSDRPGYKEEWRP